MLKEMLGALSNPPTIAQKGVRRFGRSGRLSTGDDDGLVTIRLRCHQASDAKYGSRMRIVDAQAHIFLRHTEERPWRHETALHGWEEFRADMLLDEMDAAGVDRCVLVPPSAEGDRNDTCLAAARTHPERFAVVGRINLSDPTNVVHLPGWLTVPGMLGLRVTFQRGESADWLSDGTTDWFWPAAEQAGIPLYIHAPRLIPEVRPIAQAHPSLRMIVDHAGLSAKVQPHEIAPFVGQVAALADLPNVAVKASALAAVAEDPYPFTSMHQHVRHLVDAFGHERVFWGSDITRLRCTYRQSVEMFTEGLSFLADNQLEWIMGRGLETWLDWRDSSGRSGSVR